MTKPKNHRAPTSELDTPAELVDLERKLKSMPLDQTISFEQTLYEAGRQTGTRDAQQNMVLWNRNSRRRTAVWSATAAIAASLSTMLAGMFVSPTDPPVDRLADRPADRPADQIAQSDAVRDPRTEDQRVSGASLRMGNRADRSDLNSAVARTSASLARINLDEANLVEIRGNPLDASSLLSMRRQLFGHR